MNPHLLAPLKRKKILVTGATGFIGSHLIRVLAKLGANILALSQSPNRILGIENLVKFCKVSILDFEKLMRAIEKFSPQKIVHLAGVVNLDRNYSIAKRCIQVNIQGTLNLLESLRKVPFEILTYVSTEEVYGAGKIPYRAGQKEFPPSPYAISKLAGEQFCNLYARLYHFPVCILRLSTCYGPGQDSKRLIPSILLSCLKSAPIRINSGQQRRDFLYVEDAVNGILLSLVKKKAKNQVINLGSSKSYRFVDLVKKIKKLTSSDSPVFLGSIPNRTWEAPFWQSDSSKAKKILGWKESYSLTEGLRLTIEWYKRGYGKFKN